MGNLKPLDFFVPDFCGNYDYLVVRFYRKTYRIFSFNNLSNILDDVSYEFDNTEFCKYAFEKTIFPALKSKSISVISFKAREDSIISFLSGIYQSGLPGYYYRFLKDFYFDCY